MNIKELKEVIDKLPDDMEVILQKDSEGNGFSPLADCDTNCIYIKETDWSGEIAYCTDEEWEDIKVNPKVLVLCPMN